MTQEAECRTVGCKDCREPLEVIATVQLAKHTEDFGGSV